MHDHPDLTQRMAVALVRAVELSADMAELLRDEAKNFVRARDRVAAHIHAKEKHGPDDYPAEFPPFVPDIQKELEALGTLVSRLTRGMRLANAMYEQLLAPKPEVYLATVGPSQNRAAPDRDTSDRDTGDREYGDRPDREAPEDFAPLLKKLSTRELVDMLLDTMGIERPLPDPDEPGIDPREASYRKVLHDTKPWRKAAWAKKRRTEPIQLRKQ